MMGRRKTSLAEDLMDITAALPWWMGVILAVIAYSILQHYAVLEPPTNVVPGKMSHVVIEQMGRIFAYYGQYILPLLFLFGTLGSFIKRRKRKHLIQTVGKGKPSNGLRDISWRDFELLVGEALRMHGFSLIETGGEGADGGIDLILKKEGEVFLVQCKQWRAYKVSVNVVRELLGVMVAKGAAGGFVVTSGVFTTEATSFAKGRNIELIDGSVLSVMIEKARANVSIRSATGKKNSQAPSPTSSIPIDAPNCPKCGGSMVKRVAKRGEKAGVPFWGCAEFPKCRGIRVIN
jgi:restriction system protein